MEFSQLTPSYVPLTPTPPERVREAPGAAGPHDDSPPVLTGDQSFEIITNRISSATLSRPGRGWWVGFLFAFAGLNLFLVSVGYLFLVGVGIWGVNIPVAWGFAIINFVWWIGIGHAGTLISAILLLLKQDWRTSINRFAEAMTLFAVACAGMYPILHLGRPWFFYYLVPYWNTMQLYPQWRSPLIFDVFAVSTYATVSLLFWYVGLVPDLATIRDKTKSRTGRVFYGIFALGWRGSAKHWFRYETAYLLLAGLATPLVVSVHSVVSFDFAVSVVPGWHTTIFPPYFVAGALYQGFAMVLTLLIPVRAAYGLQDYITERHLRNCAKLMLATGLVVAYGYLMEGFTGWYSGNEYEWFVTVNRFLGPYAPLYWLLIATNIVIPQSLWFPWVRGNLWMLFFVSLVVSVGMWLERFVIVVVSLNRDFLPSAWEMYAPTFWDWSTYIGTIGLFVTLIFLFMRFLPMISISEVKALLQELRTGKDFR